MVINSAFAFPLPAYEAAGEQLVVSGKRGGVMSGNSRSETLTTHFIRFPRASRAVFWCSSAV